MNDSSFEPMTMEQIEVIAEKLNCTARVATSHELMLDLDSPTAYESYQWFYGLKIQPNYPNAIVEEWRSKSGNHHVVINLGEETPVTSRIAMQAMAGSDPGREFAALKCLTAGSPHPILLFVPKAVQS